MNECNNLHTYLYNSICVPLQMAPALLVPLHTPVELCVQSSTDVSFPLHSREKSEVLREERGKWDPETGMAPGGRRDTKSCLQWIYATYIHTHTYMYVALYLVQKHQLSFLCIYIVRTYVVARHILASIKASHKYFSTTAKLTHMHMNTHLSVNMYICTYMSAFSFRFSKCTYRLVTLLKSIFLSHWGCWRFISF